MEIAGLTISVAGLATLFDMCLRGFDLLEQGKDSSRDHTILTARLNAQRANFAIWGEAVGLSASRDSNNNIFPFNSELRSVVKGHLDCISLIFEDATQLSKKYGVMPTPNNGHQTSTQESLRSYLSWFQKQTSHRKKAKWVIRDLAKFRGMLDDLSRLITDLREITSSLADIKRQREVFFAEEIAQRTDMEDLEVIEEALSQEDPTLSSAASERRTILTQTAFTNLSELNPFKNRDEDDDMHTHADSDPGAQFSDVNDTSTDHKTDVQFDDDEKSLEISAMYGHQNNLSEIQKNDEIAIARSYPFWRADSSRLARRYTLMQLKHFHDHQSETQFISIGFADNVEGTDQLQFLVGKFQAPPNIPFEGGVFAVSLTIPDGFPFAPPACRFITPIYHPNIDEMGQICPAIFDAWNPVWTLELLLTALCSLLGSPNCDDALRPEIAREFLDDRYQFDTEARLFTQRFACRDYRSHHFQKLHPEPSIKLTSSDMKVRCFRSTD